MNCNHCHLPFAVGDTAWAETGKYYCNSCHGMIFWINPPTRGTIYANIIGQLFFQTSSGFQAGPGANGGQCRHAGMQQYDLECPDCKERVANHDCEVCGHNYARHTSGTKGPCSCGTCSGYVLPPGILRPAVAAATPVATICTHPNLAQYPQSCPDCHTPVTQHTKCDYCGHEYMRHTSGIKGSCMHSGSSCSMNCQGFRLAPTSLIPANATGAMKPVTSKIVIAGGPLKIEMIGEPIKTSVVDIKAQRKKDGVCIECGDRGTFINLECVCTKGHGKIF